MWRKLPHDLPPWNVVWASFQRWRYNGTREQVHPAWRELARQQAGKGQQPTAAILESQAVRTAGKRGAVGATTLAKA
jgi:transposase